MVTEGAEACRLADIPAAISIHPRMVPALANPFLKKKDEAI